MNGMTCQNGCWRIGRILISLVPWFPHTIAGMFRFRGFGGFTVKNPSVARATFDLSMTDIMEIARYSVLQSGFEDSFKQKWLGKYYKKGLTFCDEVTTNVPLIRSKFRAEHLALEHMVVHLIGRDRCWSLLIRRRRRRPLKQNNNKQTNKQTTRTAATNNNINNINNNQACGGGELSCSSLV